MKPIDGIPTSKIKRASKIVGTGVKVGGNYLKYYGEKLVNADVDKSKLDKANADEIFKSLKSLKGTALKAAQMLSMEKNVLPKEYIDVFSLSQFSVPPLSGPLVKKTFRTYFNQSPHEVFDEFESEAVNAASIGQVHKALKNGKPLAVKIQYPGVAESIGSDLALLKPVALKLFGMGAKDADHYFKEIENKLTEETSYDLELKQSQEMCQACQHLPGLAFPQYYPEYSCNKVLTMDWMEGLHLSEFTGHHTDPDVGHHLGQVLWDFYMFQVHQLKKVHADPHPGNFMVNSQGHLVVLDFGCIKVIPPEFHAPYFALGQEDFSDKPETLAPILEKLDILRPEDSPKDRAYFIGVFQEFLPLLSQPFQAESFDFSDPAYFQKISELGEEYAHDKRLREFSKGRGSAHFLYLNRSFFGLYHLLHDLKATVQTQAYQSFLSKD